MTRTLNKAKGAARTRVIALHCSGAGASEWAHFVSAAGEEYDVLTPEHYGSESAGPWTGEHAFTLADEAARTLALIDGSAGRIHLIGHSYGGGVALYVALARPEKIASLALYEPSAFHLLRHMDDRGYRAFEEIAAVAQRFGGGVLSGDYRDAVATFVNYWNGAGAWDAMRPGAQKALLRWAPKGPLDFRALIEESTPPSAYRRLRCPVLIMRGEYAPLPTRVISEYLADLLPMSQTTVVEGAGHMGPFTHAPVVSAWLVEHIAAIDRTELRPSSAPSPRRGFYTPKPAWCPT
jgi:pimeloyl-ACP methyl ester carboxylesterase